MKKYKKFIPFIVFVFLCIVIYSKFGIINVNAETLDLTSLYEDNSFVHNYNALYYLNNGNSLYENIGFGKHLTHSSYPILYPNVYGIDFTNQAQTSFANFVSAHSTFYANVIIHFRFYYDIDFTNTKNNYWNPFPIGENWHESSSSSYHAGGGASFGEESTGNYDIYENENNFYHIYIYGQKLDLYRLNYGYTDNDNNSYWDVYAYYSKDITLYLPLSSGSTYPVSFYHDLETDLKSYGVIQTNSRFYDSYYEFSKFELSTTRNDVDISIYYDEDSCLSDSTCSSSYTDNSFFGIIKNIWYKLVSIGSGILTLPQTIWNFISGGLGALFNNLFVPSPGFFQQKFTENFNLVASELGFLFTPFELLFQILNKFQNLPNSTGIIHIPNIVDPFYNHVLIQEQDYNLKAIFQDNNLNSYYELYLNAVDIFLIISLINMFLRKFNSVFSGDGEKE